MPNSTTRDEIISAGAVPEGPIRCPRCQGGDLILRGNIMRPYTQTMVNGEIVSDELPEVELVHEVDEIVCQKCNIRFLVQTRQVADLLETNSHLAEQLSLFDASLKPC